jgi:hypothetical protein
MSAARSTPKWPATDHSGEDWTCFPSIAALMDKTDMSRATVERHLTFLWREGYISRTRRRRADGKLGIYDFTLHRDGERRSALKAARAKPQAADPVEECAAVEGSAEGGAPHVNLTYGPCVKPGPAIRQSGAQPYVNLRGQEPLGEPSEEPSTAGAREPGSEGWDEAVAAWPESGRRRTSWPRGRAAWAWACGLVETGRLLAAVRGLRRRSRDGARRLRLAGAAPVAGRGAVAGLAGRGRRGRAGA